MFRRFREKTTVTDQLEPVESNEQYEVGTINVRDLKQHVVDGYDRQKELEAKLLKTETRRDESVNELADLKAKYQVLEVVASEKSKEVNELRNSNIELERHIDWREGQFKSEIADLTDENNGLTIALKKFEGPVFTQADIDQEVSNAVQNISDLIENHKGNLSKQQAVSYVKNGEL